MNEELQAMEDGMDTAQRFQELCREIDDLEERVESTKPGFGFPQSKRTLAQMRIQILEKQRHDLQKSIAMTPNELASIAAQHRPDVVC